MKKLTVLLLAVLMFLSVVPSISASEIDPAKNIETDYTKLLSVETFSPKTDFTLNELKVIFPEAKLDMKKTIEAERKAAKGEILLAATDAKPLQEFEKSFGEDSLTLSIYEDGSIRTIGLWCISEVKGLNSAKNTLVSSVHTFDYYVGTGITAVYECHTRITCTLNLTAKRAYITKVAAFGRLWNFSLGQQHRVQDQTTSSNYAIAHGHFGMLDFITHDYTGTTIILEFKIRFNSNGSTSIVKNPITKPYKNVYRCP